MLLVIQITVGIVLGLSVFGWLRRRHEERAKLVAAFDRGRELREDFQAAIVKYVDERTSGVIERVGGVFDEQLGAIVVTSDEDALRHACALHTAFEEAADEITETVIAETIGALENWFETADALDTKTRSGLPQAREFFEKQIRERVELNILALKVSGLASLGRRFDPIKERLGIPRLFPATTTQLRVSP